MRKTVIYAFLSLVMTGFIVFSGYLYSMEYKQLNRNEEIGDEPEGLKEYTENSEKSEEENSR